LVAGRERLKKGVRSDEGRSRANGKREVMGGGKRAGF